MRQAVWTPNGFAVSVTTADGTPYELLLGDLIGIRGKVYTRGITLESARRLYPELFIEAPADV